LEALGDIRVEKRKKLVVAQLSSSLALLFSMARSYISALSVSNNVIVTFLPGPFS
jgi:hypothetical protein